MQENKNNNETVQKIVKKIDDASKVAKKVKLLKKVLPIALKVIEGIAIVALGIFLIIMITSFIEALVKVVGNEVQKFLGQEEEGAGEDYNSFDALFNAYGLSSCSFLEPFDIDQKHEYVVVQGVDSKNIYSIADGKVIYSSDSNKNLYDNYDFKTNKCLCNGSKCDNYDGNKIIIEFEVDGDTYFATYSNLDEVFVKENDLINKGDLIATEGNTGCTNGKKLTFKIEDEKGNSYNPDGFMKTCSSVTNTYNSCDFKNIIINYRNNNEIRHVNFYEYIKQELYKKFKNSINNHEVLKAETIMLTTKILKENNFKVGDKEFWISEYDEVKITDIESKELNRAMNEVLGQVLTYGNNFANIKFSNVCTRNELDKNANLIYNEFCVKSALNMNKTYEELLRIYFPNFLLNKNYCMDYATRINDYKINNDKSILNMYISLNKKDELDLKLKSRIERVNNNSRAAVVEAARFLSIGFDYKILYKNGGKHFEIGINENWYEEGFDSSGFVSWALLNGGAKIEKSLNIKELISNNTIGKIKINEELYNYFDQIQVGDFAYQNSKIGIIIGKNEGIIYVAECDPEKNLIVSKIYSYGESDSNYTEIYFADDYYETLGNITNMW